MNIGEIQLSPSFKKQAQKAVFAIVLFFIIYFLLLAISIGITAASVIFGFKMIVTIPRFLTIVLGAGLISMGGLILLFLIKFMFTRNKVDRSHLIEITKDEEPQLFKLIEEIVNEVGTRFPKKVYLMMDVNAGVFFDSSFLSLFFPSHKNLQIGLGLVNTVTKSELKAILAHEFGHFSQRSMKVGSYVYHTNQVIFNILYQNDGFYKFMSNISELGAIISIFVNIAAKIMQSIQWVLQKQYGYINKRYMALSREMEFHADEIAAHVTGLEPIRSSLLRSSMSDYAFNYTIGFFNDRVSKNIKTHDIYAAHLHVMQFLGKVDNMETENGFPLVKADELTRFNKSKLNLEQQWASHPSESDRIEALVSKNLYANGVDHSAAREYFKDFSKTSEKMSAFIFENVKYEGDIEWMSHDTFTQEYEKEYYNNILPEVYKHYYTNKDILFFDLNTEDLPPLKSDVKTLFSPEIIDKVYSLLALEQDIMVVKQIGNKEILVSSFDYDGKKYKRKHCAKLIVSMQNERDQLRSELLENDKHIYQHFLALEHSQGGNKLKELYTNFLSFDQETERRIELGTRIQNKLQFINQVTQILEIKDNFSSIKVIENEIKLHVKELLDHPKLQNDINRFMRENLEEYISKDHEYFGRSKYFDSKLEILFGAIENYLYLTSRLYFLEKKNLLDYQVCLYEFKAKSEVEAFV